MVIFASRWLSSAVSIGSLSRWRSGQLLDSWLCLGSDGRSASTNSPKSSFGPSAPAEVRSCFTVELYRNFQRGS